MFDTLGKIASHDGWYAVSRTDGIEVIDCVSRPWLGRRIWMAFRGNSPCALDAVSRVFQRYISQIATNAHLLSNTDLADLQALLPRIQHLEFRLEEQKKKIVGCFIYPSSVKDRYAQASFTTSRQMIESILANRGLLPEGNKEGLTNIQLEVSTFKKDLETLSLPAEWSEESQNILENLQTRFHLLSIRFTHAKSMLGEASQTFQTLADTMNNSQSMLRLLYQRRNELVDVQISRFSDAITILGEQVLNAPRDIRIRNLEMMHENRRRLEQALEIFHLTEKQKLNIFPMLDLRIRLAEKEHRRALANGR